MPLLSLEERHRIYQKCITAVLRGSNEKHRQVLAGRKNKIFQVMLLSRERKCDMKCGLKQACAARGTAEK
jgi:hypothetical protein